jgi:hypothetical protein
MNATAISRPANLSLDYESTLRKIHSTRRRKPASFLRRSLAHFACGMDTRLSSAVPVFFLLFTGKKRCLDTGQSTMIA